MTEQKKETKVVTVHSGYYECGDGCCTEWFNLVAIDGTQLNSNDTCVNSVVNTLEILGYDVSVEYEDTTEEDMKFYDDMKRLDYDLEEEE